MTYGLMKCNVENEINEILLKFKMHVCYCKHCNSEPHVIRISKERTPCSHSAMVFFPH